MRSGLRSREDRVRLGWLIGGVVFAIEALAVWARGYGLGGRVIVRCREGHLFSTLWIPGGSVKAFRLGPWRLQRCPVGAHWSLVRPVKAASLSEAERREADAHRDIRLP